LADLIVFGAVDIRVERGKTRDGNVVRQQVEFRDVPPCLSFRLELYVSKISQARISHTTGQFAICTENIPSRQ
jgi:hypothetical protein